MSHADNSFGEKQSRRRGQGEYRGRGDMGVLFYMGWSGEASLERRHLNRPGESKAVSLFDIWGNDMPGRGKSTCKGPKAMASLVCFRTAARRVD